MRLEVAAVLVMSSVVTSFARNGVFGRWRYVASVNAFIAVSNAGGNVFFYKHAAGEGRPASAVPASLP
jgi:hypothetical protein